MLNEIYKMPDLYEKKIDETRELSQPFHIFSIKNGELDKLNCRCSCCIVKK